MRNAAERSFWTLPGHPPDRGALFGEAWRTDTPRLAVGGWRSTALRHFGAKPDQKICRRSGGDAEFMEDPLHGRLNGIVVEIDGLWIVCAARGSEWLSGGEQGFDRFVVEDEERGHR